MGSHWRRYNLGKNEVKLLGITIDRELKFDKHVLKICTKASRKISVLA